jgi:ABC-2 type transport system permease protein
MGIPTGGVMNFFTPGLLLMTAMFSTAFTGFGLLAALRSGEIERLRVTPVNRSALLLGMVLRDAVILLVQSILLIGLGMLLGLRPNVIGTFILLGLLLLVGLTMAAVSYGLALTIRDENALASTVNFFAVPLLLLSGVMLPLSLAPDAIQWIARLNPLAHGVVAARALVNGTLGDPAVALGFGVFGVLTLLTMLWAGQALRKATL